MLKWKSTMTYFKSVEPCHTWPFSDVVFWDNWYVDLVIILPFIYYYDKVSSGLELYTFLKDIWLWYNQITQRKKIMVCVWWKGNRWWMLNYVCGFTIFIFIINSIYVIEGVVIVTRREMMFCVLFALYIYFAITSGLLKEYRSRDSFVKWYWNSYSIYL